MHFSEVPIRHETSLVGRDQFVKEWCVRQAGSSFLVRSFTGCGDVPFRERRPEIAKRRSSEHEPTTASASTVNRTAIGALSLPAFRSPLSQTDGGSVYWRVTGTFQ